MKDQGQCGSCWSFSATGTIEGAHAIATGNLVSVSEQQLMDCDTNNNACNGGNPYLALMYVLLNGGIDTEASYPYETKKSYCRASSGTKGATITGAHRVRSGSESDLEAAVSTVPTSVAIDASHYSFQVKINSLFHKRAYIKYALSFLAFFDPPPPLHALARIWLTPPAKHSAFR